MTDVVAMLRSDRGVTVELDRCLLQEPLKMSKTDVYRSFSRLYYDNGNEENGGFFRNGYVDSVVCNQFIFVLIMLHARLIPSI